MCCACTRIPHKHKRDRATKTKKPVTTFTNKFIVQVAKTPHRHSTKHKRTLYHGQENREACDIARITFAFRHVWFYYICDGVLAYCGRFDRILGTDGLLQAHSSQFEGRKNIGNFVQLRIRLTKYSGNIGNKLNELMLLRTMNSQSLSLRSTTGLPGNTHTSSQSHDLQCRHMV